VAAFACDATPAFAEGDAAAPLPDGLGLSLEVPLGLPAMFSCEIFTPVLFLQWLS
jgi:hypothetical protein